MTNVNIVCDEEVKKEERTYSVGDFFFHPDYPESVCVLVQSEANKVIMILLRHGDANRFEEPVKVVHAYNITEEEFSKITGDPESFTKISNVTISYSV